MAHIISFMNHMSHHKILWIAYEVRGYKMTYASILHMLILNFGMSFECCVEVYRYSDEIMEFELEACYEGWNKVSRLGIRLVRTSLYLWIVLWILCFKDFGTCCYLASRMWFMCVEISCWLSNLHCIFEPTVLVHS
jgi:hypothetical protein